tara:strand:+ start:371 stop:634 length:264 start_codon:yes stop_codon:yes gene_type:complete
MSKPLTHRAICYDDEGQLECCCELREGLDLRQAELLSRAEADRLVAEYQIKATAAALNDFFRHDHNELSRDAAGYDEDAAAERRREG